jgi:hypothetical protein
VSTEASRPTDALSGRRKLQESDRPNLTFGRRYGTNGIVFDDEGLPAGRTAETLIINHPSERLLEAVAATRALNRTNAA